MIFDLGNIHAVFGIFGALGCLWVMQSVTSDYDIWSKLGIVKLIHRASFAFLAIVMASNAAYTIESEIDPRYIDLIEQVAFVMVIIISAYRHHMHKKLETDDHKSFIVGL